MAEHRFEEPTVLVRIQPLMGKGRLIAKYEFGKPGIEKAQRLSNHLGFKKTIVRPMTVAGIANQEEKSFETRQTEVIEFRSIR